MTPFLRPSVHLVPTEAPTRSHFGGSLQLPPDVPWPENKGRPLDFLARVSLVEIQAAVRLDWLPQVGALLFFYDLQEQPWGFYPEDRGGAAVLYVNDAQEALMADESGAEKKSIVPYRALGFRRLDSGPSSYRKEVSSLELTDQESDLWDELIELNFQGSPRHQIGGYPWSLQGDNMELESQLVTHGINLGDRRGWDDPRVETLESGRSNWQLLFQMDTDADLGVQWGDDGLIYFWVERARARAGEFSNTWLILEC